MGGGRRGFLSKDDDGNRQDKRNLINEWMNLRNESTFVYASTRDGLLNMPYTPEYLLGKFSATIVYFVPEIYKIEYIQHLNVPKNLHK